MALFTFGVILAVIANVAYTRCGATLACEAFKYSLFFLPSSMLIVWTLAFEESAVAKAFSSPPFVIVGDLSPYTFLIHTIFISYGSSVLRKIADVSGRDVLSNPMVNAVILYFGTLIAAYVYREVEKTLEKHIVFLTTTDCMFPQY